MNLLEFMNYVFEKLFSLSIVYYTFWGLLIQMLYYLDILKFYQESVLFIVITISFFGLVLTYIYPRKLKLLKINYELTGYKLQLFDLVFHHIPLLVFLTVYDPKIKKDNMMFALASIVLYLLLFNPFNIYGFDCNCQKKENIKKRWDCDNRYKLAMVLFGIYFLVAIYFLYQNIMISN